MNRFILGLAMTAIVIPAVNAQDDYDDIYYNPKSKKETKKDTSKKSNYISDFGNMDVDDYNRRGFYYESAVDTIGQSVENAEDFVYTQQIQKYYNPTIVVDNSDVLADILEDSYGNVEIVIDNGYPTFTSIYTGSYGWAPSYYNWCMRPSWTWSYAWGPFNWTWNWGPAWAWGPAWDWGYPAWSYYPVWGYGPGWGYDPGWGPRPPRPVYHGYARPSRPGATRPGAPNPGWSNSTRPGGNYNGGASMGRPGSRPMGRPAAGTTNSHRYSDRRTQAATLSGSKIDPGLIRTNRRASVTNSTASRQAVEKSGSDIMINGTTNRSGSSVRNNRTNATATRQNSTVGRSTTSVSKGASTNTVRRQSTTTQRTSNYNQSNRTTTHNYNTTRNSNRSYNSGSSYRSGGSSRGGGSYGGGSRSSGGGHRGGRR